MRRSWATNCIVPPAGHTVYREFFVDNIFQHVKIIRICRRLATHEIFLTRIFNARLL